MSCHVLRLWYKLNFFPICARAAGAEGGGGKPGSQRIRERRLP